MTRLDVLIQVKKIIGGIFKYQLIFGIFLLLSLFSVSAVYAETVRDEFNAVSYSGNDGTKIGQAIG